MLLRSTSVVADRGGDPGPDNGGAQSWGEAVRRAGTCSTGGRDPAPRRPAARGPARQEGKNRPPGGPQRGDLLDRGARSGPPAARSAVTCSTGGRDPAPRRPAARRPARQGGEIRPPGGPQRGDLLDRGARSSPLAVRCKGTCSTGGQDPAPQRPAARGPARQGGEIRPPSGPQQGDLLDRGARSGPPAARSKGTCWTGGRDPAPRRPAARGPAGQGGKIRPPSGPQRGDLPVRGASEPVRLAELRRSTPQPAQPARRRPEPRRTPQAAAGPQTSHPRSRHRTTETHHPPGQCERPTLGWRLPGRLILVPRRAPTL
jgi:hypothetical protein